MSSGGTFTQTGVNEMRQAVEQLPAAVTSALRGVAEATSQRMLIRAQALLREHLKTSRSALINAMVIEEDAANRVFRVVSKTPSGQPANLPLWNEYGTVKMSARPYMHPSAEAERARYQKDGDAASVAAVAELLK
jgi:hypothetical protein